MNINVNYYNKIYEDFIARQPYYEEHVAKVIPKNTNSIRVILKDGSTVDSNIRTQTFNQPELSKRTGLSVATISKYMKKQATPTITNLEKIAYALNCSRDDLME